MIVVFKENHKVMYVYMCVSIYMHYEEISIYFK